MVIRARTMARMGGTRAQKVPYISCTSKKLVTIFKRRSRRALTLNIPGQKENAMNGAQAVHDMEQITFI